AARAGGGRRRPPALAPLVGRDRSHCGVPGGPHRGIRLRDDRGRPVPVRRGRAGGDPRRARTDRGLRLAGRGRRPRAVRGPPAQRAARAVRRVGQVVASSRPLSWVNTAFPFGAAYLLAGGGTDAAFWVGCVWFLVPYNLLMYGVNDVFDYESDLRNPRKGGVEGVVLDRGLHRATLWAAALANIPFIAVLLWWGTVPAALVLAVSVFAVVAYSAPGLRFKERPFLDSLTSSTHFVGPAAYGLALAAGRAGEVDLDPTVVAALGGFFLWGIGSHAFGAVQDVAADREAGIGSIGTVLGA